MRQKLTDIRTLFQKYPLLTIFVALQIVDFSTTWLGVTTLGAHEVNPVGLLFVRSLGLFGTLLLFKLWACTWAGMGVRKKGDVVLRSAVWIYGVAMTWNVGVLCWYALHVKV